MGEDTFDAKNNKSPLLLRILGGGTPYFVKTPRWLKMVYPKRTWHLPANDKTIYLTFDDGPHPVATPFVLDTLKSFGAHATFFCIGKNVAAHPEIYERILREGHRVGNHTFQHLNGWKTDADTYLADVKKAEDLIDSRLFRPPYGRMSGEQVRRMKGYHIIMWDVLSGDFDTQLAKEKCLDHVLTHTKAGSIVVFHDSEKAFAKLSYCLPELMKTFVGRGFRFDVLPDIRG